MNPQKPLGQQDQPPNEAVLAFATSRQQEVLTRVSGQDLQELARCQMPVIWILAAGGGGIALCGIALWFSSLWAVLPGSLALAGSLFWLLYLMAAQRRILAAHAAQLDEAYEQLQQLSELMSGYLDDVDRLTTRYFHCVEHDSVVHYFTLREIQGRLSELLKRITDHSGCLSPENLCAIYEILQAPFKYYDGLQCNAGELHAERLADVPRTVEGLVLEIEKSLQELELEIKAWNRYTLEAKHEQDQQAESDPE